MAIDKKLILFKTRKAFDASYGEGDVLNSSIVFIEDTGELWTKGKFFCKTDGSDHNHNGVYLPIDGTAKAAEKLSNIITSFNGKYPVTVNVGGIIYSHTGLQFEGSTGILTATKFSGDLAGNASTTTKLKTARTLWGKSFDGSANILGDLIDVENITINALNEADRFISFLGNANSTYSWRMGYLGSGVNDTNYMAFQTSGTNGTWTNALRLGLITKNALFAGDILPDVNNSKNIGSSSLKFANIYATTFNGNVTGSSGSCTGNAATVTGGVYVSTDQEITGLKTFKAKSDKVAPFAVSGSTVKVVGLNADLLDGYNSSYFLNRDEEVGIKNLICKSVYNNNTNGYKYTKGLPLVSGKLNRINLSGESSYTSTLAKIESEGTYTLSFYYKVEGFSSEYSLLLQVNDIGIGTIKVTKNSDWAFFSCSGYVTNTSYGFLDIEGSFGGSFVMSDIVLVRGTNIIKSWIPAPEDKVNTSDFTWTNLPGKPTWIGTTKPSYSFSEISGTATIAQVSGLQTALDDKLSLANGGTIKNPIIINKPNSAALTIKGSGGDDTWVNFGEYGDQEYSWLLRYMGTTSGTGGNEFRIASRSTSKHWQFDHDGNFEYYDGKAYKSMWHAGNFDPSTKANIKSPTFTNTLDGSTITAVPQTTPVVLKTEPVVGNPARTPTYVNQIATAGYVQDSINQLIGGASSTLDTLGEIQQYLADNGVADVITGLASKVSKDGDTMTGDLSFAFTESGTGSGFKPGIAKGIRWSGSSDGAYLYYKADVGDRGLFILDLVDDTDCIYKINWNNSTSYTFNKTSLIPGTTNTISLGSSSLKFSSVYATTFLGSLTGNADTVTNGVYTNTAQNITAKKTFTVQQAFTVAQGSSPFTVTSDTLVDNLNSNYLEGKSRSNLYTGLSGFIKTIGYSYSFIVNGSSNTYYPVLILGCHDKDIINTVSVWKNLGSLTASYVGNHSNGTSSMWAVYEYRNTGWDGNNGFVSTKYVSLGYAKLLLHTSRSTKAGALIVFLRGGGTQYNISLLIPGTVTVKLEGTTIDGDVFSPMTEGGNNGVISEGFRLYGNALSADKLATKRKINGTDFDGTADITTANWGTSRTLTIGSTGKSVNGSGNVAWSLSEIGAAAASHTHSYLPLSGGTLTGTLKITTSQGINIEVGSGWAYHQLKSGSSTAHLAFNNTAISGHLANTYHIRPDGATSVLGINTSHVRAKAIIEAEGGILIPTDKSIEWARNTDYAKIHFKNTSDGDTDSYLGFETGDNGNEYFKFSAKSGSTLTELFSIKSDTARIKGHGIWHAGNSGTTAYNWSAKSLTLAGGISGATAIASTATLDINATNDIRLRAGARSLILTSTYLKPYDVDHNTMSLGTSGARWSTIYGTSLNLNGTISGATTITSSGEIAALKNGRAASFGGTTLGTPNGTIANQTGFIQIMAGTGSASGSSGLIFHNPGISTAGLEYKNTDANNGYFNFRSDDTNWNLRVNNNEVWHRGNSGSTSYDWSSKINKVVKLQFMHPTSTSEPRGSIAYEPCSAPNEYAMHFDLTQMPAGYRNVYFTNCETFKINNYNVWHAGNLTGIQTGHSHQYLNPRNGSTYKNNYGTLYNTSEPPPSDFTSWSSYTDSIHWGHDGGVKYKHMISVHHGDRLNIWFSTSYNNEAFTSYKLWTSGNFDPNTKLNTSGGTLSGALNFANLTWNNVGDDVAIGDCNVAGMLGIKGLNSAIPGIAFYNNSGTQIGQLGSNAGTLQWSGNNIWHTGNDSQLLKKRVGYSAACAHYSTTGSTSGILIKIPNKWNPNTSWMISFTVRVYQSYNFYDVIFSGYNYGGSKWYSPNARMIVGSGNIAVKMGWSDNGHLYVWLAGGSYTGATVFNVNNGYTQSSWDDGWEITNDGNCPNVQWESTLIAPQNAYAPSTSGGYLPLNGGRMAGVLESTSSDPALRVLSGTTSKAAYGWLSNHGTYIYNYNSGKYLGIKDDGTPHYHGSTLWHTGNLTGNQTGHGHQYLNTCGRLSQEANSSRASGMRFYEIYGNGYPFSYGNLLQLNGINGISQLAMQWHGNEIYYRSAPDTSTAFNSWARLWSSTNFNPDNYVPKASGSRPGVTRVYRDDYDDNYNVRVRWESTFDGSRWVWKGYQGDTYHAGCYVASAEKANTANSSDVSARLSTTTISDLNSPNWGENQVTFQTYNNGAANKPYSSNNANGVLNFSFSKHGASGHYGFQLAHGNGSERLYFRQWTNGSLTGWKTVAYTSDILGKSQVSEQLEAFTAGNFTGGSHYLKAVRYDGWHTRLYMGYHRDDTRQNTVHVGYADQLQTSRTIWGQSFNGTGNVSGGLSGVTAVASTGELDINAASLVRIRAGSRSLIFNTSTNHFKPYDSDNNIIDLGLATARWKTIYGTALNLNGTLSGATTIDATSTIKSTVSSKSIEMVAHASYGKIQSRGSVPIVLNPEGNNVAINTTVASINLAIGDSDTGFKWNSDGNISGYANNVSVFNWTSTGISLLKNTSITGNLSISGNITQTSSFKYKTEIFKFEKKALDLINKINVVSFKYKTDLENEHIGFIAEDTPSELSTKLLDKMDMGSCIGVLLKAVQELQEEIKNLKK